MLEVGNLFLVKSDDDSFDLGGWLWVGGGGVVTERWNVAEIVVEPGGSLARLLASLVRTQCVLDLQEASIMR